MSDQTAANTPSEPRLCKMGCGFFGNGATDGCCSKCWRDMQKKQEPPAAHPKPLPKEEAQPMDVEEPAAPPAAAEVPQKVEEEPAAAPVAVSKKKKKKSYKNMMASMMKSSGEKDVQKEKEGLRKVTGGGAFAKIDKI